LIVGIIAYNKEHPHDEYAGKTDFIDLLAPVRKLWRWATRNREPAIASCWPFDNQAELTDHERLIK
jgi:hypothetical protein